MLQNDLCLQTEISVFIYIFIIFHDERRELRVRDSGVACYMNNIDEILEQMEELLDKSSPMPFSQNKMIIDSERFRELIDDIRLNIPQEIKRAKLIDFDCERIIKEAEQKAEKIVQQAEERAKTLVASDTIVKEAKQRGSEIVSQAQARAQAIKAATTTYVDNMLHDAEIYFTKGLQDVKRTSQEINRAKNSGKGNTEENQNAQ